MDFVVRAIDGQVDRPARSDGAQGFHDSGVLRAIAAGSAGRMAPCAPATHGATQSVQLASTLHMI
jgi:hypothetical protein